MIYVTASSQIVQYDGSGLDGASEPPSEACPACLKRAEQKRRPGESVRCFHVIVQRRRPLAKAPAR